jgi:hypothetical protein
VLYGLAENGKNGGIIIKHPLYHLGNLYQRLLLTQFSIFPVCRVGLDKLFILC